VDSSGIARPVSRVPHQPGKAAQLEGLITPQKVHGELDGDIGEALELPSQGANKVQTDPTPNDTIQPPAGTLDLAA
jgi:hypothetical protein